MSDTDSSEDETNARLLASVDTSFLSDALYKPNEAATKGDKGCKKNTHTVSGTDASKAEAPKSNRYLVEEDTVWKSDLNVTESMRKHLSKMLSQIIESRITFEDVSPSQPSVIAKKTERKSKQSGVRLLSSSQDFIEPAVEEPFVQQKPPPIRRRVVEHETEPNPAHKIAASVATPGKFPEEVRHWKAPKRRSTEFHYTKKANGLCIEKEHVPPNEFTAARLKNGWDESKIKTFKRKPTSVRQ